MPPLSLVWDLIARDGASPAFLKVSAAADAAAASTEKAAVQTEASASKMGSALLKWAAPAALVGFGVEAVKMASQFQSSMLLIQTQAGASADEVRKMTPAILSLSGQVAQAPEALATSLYHVESTGLRGKDALEAVRIAAEGAAVGHADLEQTTNALTATIASGMLPATETYAQAMGQLNTIVGSGDMKMQDLNDALGTGLLVTTKQYGVTLTDVGAALADFGDNNIRGADAATMVRMAVQSISKPSATAAGDLKQIGLTVEQLQSDQQTGGLNKALTDLHSHLTSSGIEASKWGGLLVDAFTKKAGAGIITLIGTYDRFEQKYKEVGAGSDSFAAAYAATTHTMAFQTKAFEDNVKALTISFGNGLLPAATDAMTWINQDGIPILKSFGSGAQDAAKWFGGLPGPIRDTALALGAVAAANAVGLTGLLATGAGKVAAGFGTARDMVVGFSDELAVQQALNAMEARSLGQVDAALGGLGGGLQVVSGELTNVQLMLLGWDAALAETTVAEETATAANGGFAASLGTMAARGGAAVTSGLGKVTSFLGGPWGVALAAGVLAMTDFNNVEQKSTDQSNAWVEALKKGGDSARVASAQIQSVLNGVDTNSFAFKTIDSKNTFLGSLQELLPGLNIVHDKIVETAGAAVDAKNGFAAWEKSLSPTELAQEKLTIATAAFQSALASGDTRRVAITQKDYATALQASNDATDKLSRAQAIMAAGAPAAANSLALIGDISGMNKDQIAAATKAIQDQQKQLQKVDDAFINPLKTYQDMAQKMAEDTAKATGNSKASWKDYVDSVKVDLGQYAGDLEKQIKDEENWQANLVTIARRGGADVAKQLADMGVAGAGLTAQMADATGANFDRMAKDLTDKAALGSAGAAQALQQGMAVAAAAGAQGAKATVQGIAAQLGLGADVVRAIAQTYGLNLAEGIDPLMQALGKGRIHVAGLNGQPGGYQTPYAEGGYTGPGGKYTPAGIVHAGEFVFPQEAVNRLGVGFLGSMAGLPGYATGGFVNAAAIPHPSSTAPYRAPLSTAADAAMGSEYAAAVAWMNANGALGLPGAPANVTGNLALAKTLAAAFGWDSGTEWNALYATGQRESGWNNTAQNPTSTAYGIPQFLDSTWATVGMSKTSDPGAQIAGMLRYIGQRYGDPIGAWRHEQNFGWYKDGTNFVPNDGPAYLHRGEAVIPAAKNQGAPYQSGPAVFHLYDADGALLGSMRGIAQHETAGALTAIADRGSYNG